MGKDYWYRESVNVPFLIRYPAMQLSGKSDEIVSIPDIFPTLLELMEMRHKTPSSVVGQSFYNVLQGGKGSEYAYYCSEFRHTRGVISKQYTYAVYRKQNGFEREYLYDNFADPYQLYNIVSQEPDVVQMMRDELKKMCQRGDDPWFSEYYSFPRV